MLLSPKIIGGVYLYYVLVSGDNRKFGRMATTKDERRKSLTIAGTFVDPEQNLFCDLCNHLDRR